MLSAVAARLASKLLAKNGNPADSPVATQKNRSGRQLAELKDVPDIVLDDPQTSLSDEEKGSDDEDDCSNDNNLCPKRSKRYFSTAVMSNATKPDEMKRNDTPFKEETMSGQDPEPSSSSPLPSIKRRRSDSFKRHHREPKPSFVDPKCVSNWEPIWGGTEQNVERFEDPIDGSEGWIFGLLEREALIPIGTLNLQVLSGSVEISGSIITSNSKGPTEIFAPPSHPLPIIRSTIHSTLGTLSSNVENVSIRCCNFASVIRITNLNTGIQAIDRVWSSSGLKRSIWKHFATNQPLRGKNWTLVLSLTPEVACLRSLPSWSDILSTCNRAPTINSDAISYLVQGSKGSGKSTFSTLLINSLLNRYQRVALLDLDPGQPILTPPTLISLHLLDSPILGPTFCRLVSPYLSTSTSIYLGHTSPKDCPSRYLEASNKLLNIFYNLNHSRSSNQHQQNQSFRGRRFRKKTVKETVVQDSLPKISSKSDVIPLVINTIGWTKGLGEDLLTHICQSIEPTHIFNLGGMVEEDCHLQSTGPPIGQGKECFINIESVDSNNPLSQRLTSSDSRMINLISYFNASPLLENRGRLMSKYINRWKFEEPIWRQRPYEVAVEPIELPDHQDFDKIHLGYVLNGTIIGFVEDEDDEREGSELGRWIGFGLIRGIDDKRKVVQILTPACPIDKPEINQSQNDDVERRQEEDDFYHCQRRIKFLKYSEPEVPVILLNLADYLEESAGLVSKLPPYFARIDRGGRTCNDSNKTKGKEIIDLVGSQKKRFRRNVQRRSQLLTK
ncbi:hypothetical protein PPACK8108_LOCUS25847 [Phakopsora pachyrhizi]|uniref:Polynucleotide 5'-hydroxyl-kinase GRC3 n=1 Tax=Phakopsora pachyrhizi TaxID=170000 RepID=A0AAV0BWI5_PHAPC|nr:hypothetical protein PPACK8108_LOCUS25847 [Phakopsora pachyrhizi]